MMTTVSNMLFGEPLGCPAYAELSFEGLAIDDADGLYVVIRARDARLYLGPNGSDVARSIRVLAAALIEAGHVPVDRMAEVAAWLVRCRELAINQIADAARTLPTER